MRILENFNYDSAKVRQAEKVATMNTQFGVAVTPEELKNLLEEAVYFSNELRQNEGLHPELQHSYQSLRDTAIRKGLNRAKQLVKQCEMHNAAAKAYIAAFESFETTLTDSYLKEGNSVSGKLPAALDSWLQDVAQITGQISYNDIIKLSSDSLPQLKKLYQQWAELDFDQDEAEITEIGKKVKSLIR